MDASKLGLGFILMQKDSKGRSSILQAGSTSLKDIKAQVDACKRCLELQPSKSQAPASGLNIPVEKLNPMDWLSTDLAQKVLHNGKKVNFLVIVDRASGFVRVYQLRGTKKRHIIECL